MREIEEINEEKMRLKRRKIAKLEAVNKHLVIPDVSKTDYERQMRKLATRGGDMLLSLPLNILKLF